MASLVENTLMAIADLGIIPSSFGRHAVGTCGISSFCYANSDKLLTLLVSQHHIFSHYDDCSDDDVVMTMMEIMTLMIMMVMMIKMMMCQLPIFR